MAIYCGSCKRTDMYTVAKGTGLITCKCGEERLSHVDADQIAEDFYGEDHGKQQLQQKKQEVQGMHQEVKQEEET